jgi:hypothetical protein
MNNPGIPGIYSFHRQEMVASFRFLENGRFDFFYSYGAADRSASGTYITEGDTIKLKSDKEPGKDFTIVKQEKRDDGYCIKVTDPNPHLAGYVMAIYFINGQQQVAECNNLQEILIPERGVDKIYLQHRIFPDIPTLLKDDNTDSDYFEVTLNRSLEQVSFKGIDLFIKDDGLHCHPNYFMPVENMVFRKKEA